jgi:hypothetical protein
LIVLGILGSAALFFGVMKLIKSSEAYQTAVAAATNSPEVQAKLGTPITTGLMIQGNVKTNTSDGTTTGIANLTIPLKGPKGTGSLHYAATKNGSTWVVSDFTVTIDGTGESITLGP